MLSSDKAGELLNIWSKWFGTALKRKAEKKTEKG
jgi:hypothetical protein